MDLYDRYDELDNLINGIDDILLEITDKTIKEELEIIKYEYLDEYHNLEEEIADLEEAEERELEREYWGGQF